MICELYNKIQYFVDVRILELHSRNKTEVTLLEFVVMILMGLLIALFIAWWFIPIKKIFNLMDNVSFKCDKK